MQTYSTQHGSSGFGNNDRPFLIILTIVVALLHALLVLRLLEPSDKDDINKPVKVVEVVILPPEPVVPKEKAAPPAPAPAQPVVQKTVTPKKPPPKKIVKPVVKKEAVIPKPTPVKPVIEDRPPVLTAPITSPQKPTFLASPSTRPAAKPVAKPGNGESNSKGVSSGVALISRVKPVYPARATSRHIEGWVKIEFTVTPSGTVSGPSVVSASPSGIFDSAALDAIMRWRFKPKMVNGQAVAQRAVQTIKFTLSK